MYRVVMLDYGAKKRSQRVEKASKREKKTKEIMEVLYNFHDLHEMVKYEKFYERSYIEEFHSNCSVSKIRKRLFLCKKLEFVITMQHIEISQDFLVLKSQLQYVRQYHPKKLKKAIQWSQRKETFKGIQKETGNLAYKNDVAYFVASFKKTRQT